MTSDGRRFAGYELGEFLGNGLAGRVHAGRRTANGIEVAIEVIAPPLGSDPGFRRRLDAGAVRAAVLHHPAILTVHEAVAGGEREMALITDPYRGVPLAAIVPGQGIPLAGAALVADAVLLALLRAHHAGIVHGAVAPGAVIVDEAGRIKLAGFALGRALSPDGAAERATDIAAVTALTTTMVHGGRDASESAVPQHLRSVLRRATTENAKRGYQTAAGMRSALAAAARHDVGPDWREAATAELATLYAGRGTNVDPADLMLDLPPAPTLLASGDAAGGATADHPSPPPAEQVEELPLDAPPAAVLPQPVVPVAPVVRGVPEARRPRRRHRVFVAGTLVAACVALGVVAGLVVSAVRGGVAGAGPLHVGTPVSLKVEPAQGSCNSVFTATATGTVQGQGTLVYRWERSDGLQSADTPLPVSSSDGSFLITQHWALSGTVSQPAITFRLLAPVRMTVTRQLRYSCP